MILVLGRGLKQKYPVAISVSMKNNRLLIISPFNENIKRVSKETSIKRNEFIFQIADEIFIPFAIKGGSLESLIIKTNDKTKIHTFDCDENKHLTNLGVNSIEI